MRELDEGLNCGVRRHELVAALWPRITTAISRPGRPHDRSTKDDEDVEHERRPGSDSEHAEAGWGQLGHRARVSAVRYQIPDKKTEYQGPGTKYPCDMKILISLAIVAAIAGIVYKVLTTEIPIDES